MARMTFRSFAVVAALISEAETLSVLGAIAGDHETGAVNSTSDSTVFRNESYLMQSEVAIPFFHPERDIFAVPITCNNRTISVPPNALLLTRFHKRVMICPNAKVGSSTLARFIHTMLVGNAAAPPSESRDFLETYSARRALLEGRTADICDVSYSLTIVRNPFDRLRSAFADKINRVSAVPGVGTASFGNFVDALRILPPDSLNAHWMPISTHCATNGPTSWPYSKIYKIEDGFEQAMYDAFAVLGFPPRKVRVTLSRIGLSNVNKFDSHDLEARFNFFKDKRPDLVQLIQKYYADDLLLGNYSFSTYP